jgi:hypothetical protein
VRNALTCCRSIPDVTVRSDTPLSEVRSNSEPDTPIVGGTTQEVDIINVL